MEKIREEAAIASSRIVPQKSKRSYDKEFNEFNQRCREKNVHMDDVEEDLFLAYFLHLSKKVAPSSMWTKYSMLKSTLRQYKRIDISKYGRVVAFLKSLSKGYKPKKSMILEREHIEQFLKEAPNAEYLMAKVALIMGISGACRCDELVKLTLDNVQDKGAYFHVNISDTKTYTSRNFTIIKEGYPVNPLELITKYLSLRPKHTPHRRFFVNYRCEKCTVQPVGINTLSKIPTLIAKFLKLPNAASYTGHCMRRSSATLLANAGGDIIKVKQLGGSIAESYIEESVSSKLDLARKIQGCSSTEQAMEATPIEQSKGTPALSSLQFDNEPVDNSSSNVSSTVINLSKEDCQNKSVSVNFNININFK